MSVGGRMAQLRIEEVQSEVRAFVAKTRGRHDDTEAILEIRDVLGPGSLESYEYVHHLVAGNKWARMVAVNVERDRPPTDWAWYRIGNVRDLPMSHQVGTPWVKVAGQGIG